MSPPTPPTCVDPAVAILERDEATVQIGIDPSRYVLVAGTVDEVARAAAGLGRPDGPTRQDQQLHDRLAAADLVRCGGRWRPATDTRVQVVGSGAVAHAVHAALARLDLGRCERIPALPGTAGDLVVVAPDRGRASEMSDELQSRGLAHLWAHIRDGRAVVGPLVTPGRTACLRCVDLWTTVGDTAWPLLLTRWEQSTRPAHLTDPAVWLVGGLVAGQVSRWLGGEQRCCWGATLEEQPDGTVVRRLWPRHPDCGCAWSQPSCPGTARSE